VTTPLQQKSFITGVEGLALTDDERAFLKSERPAGLILFARNLADRAQIRRLVIAVRTAIGTDDILILIDQEGGRVQRLRPPLARALPPAASFAALYPADLKAAIEAAQLISHLVAAELSELGINTNCVPVLDVPAAGAHEIIGDRAYGRDTASIIALGRAVANSFMAAGVLPVMKHIPGHGRAGADSHLELPRVTASLAELSAIDFVPFRALRDLPAAMTAHVVFTALDSERPASTSPTVISETIRGTLGFDGLLISDDLSMKALTGDFTARTAAVLEAGSDLALHCNGDLAEMRAVAAASPVLAGPALDRFQRAIALTKRPPAPFDQAAAETVLARMLGAIA
jgi:beta-N-acetylhexosaminidase